MGIRRQVNVQKDFCSNDYTLYVVEDINGTHTDPYHYKLYFNTNVLPEVELKP